MLQVYKLNNYSFLCAFKGQIIISLQICPTNDVQHLIRPSRFIHFSMLVSQVTRAFAGIIPLSQVEGKTARSMSRALPKISSSLQNSYSLLCIFRRFEILYISQILQGINSENEKFSELHVTGLHKTVQETAGYYSVGCAWPVA